MPIVHNGEELLTAKEAAEYIHVSAVTFKKIADQYHVPWLTRLGAGHRKFFKKNDLERFLQFQPGQAQQQTQQIEAISKQ